MGSQKFRLTPAEVEQLQKIAAGLVRPDERHKHQRPDTSLVGPLVRLIANGSIIPVRVPADQSFLEGLLGGDKQETLSPLLSRLLEGLAKGELKIVRG